MVSTTSSLQRPITQTHESGLIARLGGWSAAHLRIVLVGQVVVMGVLGAFAPQVQKKFPVRAGRTAAANPPRPARSWARKSPA